MSEITSADVVEEARRLVSESPDFIYAPEGRTVNNMGNCRYVHTEAITGALVGGCLFGQAFINLGFAPEEVTKHEGMPAEDAMDKLGISMVDSTHPKWIETAQYWQDTRYPWGQAVEEADKAVRHYEEG